MEQEQAPPKQGAPLSREQGQGLRTLLLDVLGAVDGLREFARYGLPSDLRDVSRDLPGGTTSDVAVAQALVESLVRWGLVDGGVEGGERLYELLRNHRPALNASIREGIDRLWPAVGFTPPPLPPPDAPPSPLVEAAQHGHLVVLLGGAEDGTSLWELLGRLTVGDADLERERDPEVVLDTLRTRLGDHEVSRRLAAALPAVHSDVVAAVAALPGTVFVTSAIGDGLPRALAGRTGRPPKVSVGGRGEDLNHFGLPGSVWKLAGSIEDLGSLNGGRLSTAARKRMEALLQAPHVVLLVGFDADSSEVMRIYEELREAYGAPLDRLWALVPPSPRRRGPLERRGIRVIESDRPADWLRGLEAAIQRSGSVLRVAEIELGSVFGPSEAEIVQLLERGDWAEAATRGEAERAKARLLDGPEARRLVARLTLRIASARLNLQELDAAVVELRAVDPAELDAPARAVLAGNLANAGLHDEAERVAVEPGEVRDRIVQIAAIAHGEEPVDLLDHPDVLRAAAQLRGRVGDVRGAAALGLRVLEHDRARRLDKVEAFLLLVRCVVATLWEQSWVTLGVSSAQGPALVAALDAFDRGLRTAGLPNAVTIRCLAAQHDWAAVEERAGDVERLRAELAGLDSAGAPALVGEDLSGGGDVEIRLESARTLPHPWLGTLQAASILQSHGQVAQAATLVAELRLRFPGRPLLDLVAARILLAAGELELALEAARSAATFLPTRAHQVTLAEVLAQTGDWAEVEAVLGAAEPADPERVRLLHALAASNLHPARAVREWERCVEADPDNARYHWAHADALRTAAAGDPERLREAADEAWDWHTRLTPELDKLASLGRLLTEAGGPEAPERIRALVAEITAAFPGDIQADTVALVLGQSVGLPPDPDALGRLERAGAVTTLGLTEARELERNAAVALGSADQGLRDGLLPWEAWSEVAGYALGTLFSRVLAGEEPRLPFPAGLLPPPDSLGGVHLLLGVPELLFLAELELLEALDEALGADGRWAFFDDVVTRVRQEAALLPTAYDREGLAVLTALEAWVSLHATDTSAQVSAEEGGPDIERFLQRLHCAGELTSDVLARLGVAADGEVPPLSGRAGAALGAGAWLDLARRCAAGGHLRHTLLDAVHTAAGGLSIRKADLNRLRERGSTLKRAADMGRRAVRIHGWIERLEAEHRRRTIIRPLPNLPPTHRPEHDWARRALALAASWSEALAEDPRIALLTVDTVVGGLGRGGAPLEILTTLKWRPESAPGFFRRMRAGGARTYSLPHLARRLLPPAERAQMRRRLAGWGFFEALEPRDLVDLARTHFTMARGEPERLLTRAEWPASERAHPQAAVAGVALTGVYARAILLAWFGDEAAAVAPLPASVRVELTRTLLDRVGALDLTANASTLVLGGLLDHAVAAFRRSGSTAELTDQIWEESPHPALWRTLLDHAGVEGRAAMGWQLAILLATEGERLGTAQQLVAGFLAMESGQGRAHDLLDLPATRAVAILSWDWTRSPLDVFRVGGTVSAGGRSAAWQVDLGEAIRRAASMAGASGIETSGFAQLVTLEANETLAIPFRVPAEAALLRAELTVLPKAAHDWAELIYFHDPPLAKALWALADAPTDAAARRAVALRAATMPAQHLRDDSGWFARWGQPIPGNEPIRALRDVRALLDEPDVLEASEAILSRFADGGRWAGRDRGGELALGLGSVPGELAGMVASALLDSGAADWLIPWALRVLEEHEDFTSGEVALALTSLLHCMSSTPRVEVEGRVIDLAEALPRLVSDILKRPPVPPTATPAPTVASAEPELLRLCGQVLAMLSVGARMEDRDAHWLCHRLHRWLVEELRQSGRPAELFLAPLVRFAPPLATMPQSRVDALGPHTIGPGRLDLRTLLVLHALALAEVPTSPGRDNARGPALAAHPQLIDTILDLAARELTPVEQALRRQEQPSSLPLPAFPTVPDAALAALLLADPALFFRLPGPARRRWIGSLSASDPSPAPEGVRLGVLHTLATSAHELTPPERDLAATRVVGQDSPAAWMARAALWGVGAELDEGALTAGVVERLDGELGQDILRCFLLALCRRRPSAAGGVAREILSHGPSLVPFAWAVGGAIFGGDPIATAALATLLQELPARATPQEAVEIGGLLSLLGIDAS